MQDFSTRLTYLFQRYYSGGATVEEKTELMAMVQQSQSDEQLTDLLKKTWEESEDNQTIFTKEQSADIFRDIVSQAPDEAHSQEKNIFVPGKLYWWRYAAAAILLVCGLGVFYKFNSAVNPVGQMAPAPALTNDAAPGGNRATLTLADGSEIILDDAANGLLARQGSAEVRKSDDGQVIYNADKTTAQLNPNQMNTLATPKGGQYQIVLPDGSKVWLNASSSIRFPAVFAGHERKVEITGEVYFEVQKDRTRPFKVRFQENEIEVLGTSFNVMTYLDEPSSKTTLIEGAVSLVTRNSSKKLKPGQQAAISSAGNIKTSEVDIEEAIAWKKGLFYFRNESIEDVMKKAARWYDIQIEYRGAVPVRQFTGKVSMDVNISELLNMLNYAGMNCKIENKKVIISN
jgi:transmembrane sensor